MTIFVIDCVQYEEIIHRRASMQVFPMWLDLAPET
jgi:hypothetical protein